MASVGASFAGSKRCPGSRAALASGRGESEEQVSGFYRRAFELAIRRPWLVPTLIGTAWSFRARGWLRRPPFLPLPPRSYIRWRMETAYGDPDATPPLDEFERYVRWAAAMRRRM